MSDVFANNNPEAWQEDGVLSIQPFVRRHAKQEPARPRPSWAASFSIAAISFGAVTLSSFGTSSAAARDSVIVDQAYLESEETRSDVVAPGYWAALDRVVNTLPSVEPDADFDIEPFI